jgi:hypothetical protein
MVIIGAAAMVYALIRISKPANPDDKSNISIPIPGLGKIELGGPSWLILFAVGALMVAFPALVVFAQQTPKTTTPGITDQKVQQAERLIEENVSSFQFVSDLSILDLRQSQETPWYVPIRALFSKDAKQFIKPAILRNVMVVKRRTAAKDLVLTYSTSGTLVLRCLSHAATYQENKEPQDGKPTDTWAVIVDVSSEPMNKEFQVVVEATYYDAFSRPDQWSYSTYGNRQDEDEELSVLLVFPDKKPFSEIDVQEFPPNGGQGGPFSGLARSYPPTPDGKSYYWVTTNRRSDYHYTMRWRW